MIVDSVLSAKAASVVAGGAGGDVKMFLSAIASVLRETVAAFESTVSRVTEITAVRPGRADRELVVALQDFDRLQQEFASLSEVIAKLSLESTAADAPAALAAISIADMRDRLARKLRELSSQLPAGDESADVVF